MRHLRRAFVRAASAGLFAAAVVCHSVGAAAQAPAPSLDVSVVRGELTIAASGFPLAAGADGSTLVVPVEANTAAGAPNLELRFLERATGRVTRTVEVLSVAEGMRFVRSGDVSAARADAVRARARRALDAVRALGSLTPLEATPRTWPVDDSAPGPVSAPVRLAGAVAYTVQISPQTLRVYRGASAQGAATEVRLPTAPGTRDCAPHAPVVTGLYPFAGGLLVHIGFRGTDMCWEPAPTWRVVAM